MKKFLLMMSVAVALSLTSCQGDKNYKAKGEELSKQLNESVEKQDTASAISTDDQIRKMEEEIAATGDTAALNQFRAAMKDARVRNAAYLTVTKIHNGMDKDEAVHQLMDDALKQDINIHAVTQAINAVLTAENKEKDNKKEK